MRRLALFVTIGAASLLAAPPALAATREYWVAAVPTTFNIVPNGHDAIMGMRYGPADTVFGTTVYRRYTAKWRKEIPGDGTIIGPLIKARVGDRIRVHFKNLDPARPHSMHFHGVSYKPSSDGAYLPGYSGRDADVKPGQTYTYALTAGNDSAGAWPYHDHGPEMEASIDGGMFGMLSILGRHERAPDREFVVAFSPMGKFQAIDGRAFVGNTPVFHSRAGDLVQWDVMAMGSEHHTFHVHGHRWRDRTGTPVDTVTIGPAESARIRWRERDPGTWLYHCHVETHMAAGMIGTYRVSRT
ncbi:MAG TPA: multicopper oxidase domain-containing protein [Solirubrobacter sp.]|nr:multicopper oxidase domain-containing protein [Solirubrobacter sp.]